MPRIGVLGHATARQLRLEAVDRTAAVGVDEPAQELARELVGDLALPRLEHDRPVVLAAGAVLRKCLEPPGARPDDAMACPRTSDIGGRSFRNADGVRPGRMTLVQAFARSCNTAFVGATRRLDARALDAAARAFGVGGAWDPGIEAYTGQAPVGDDPVEQAATVIGQGRVLVSPLLMATVAATVQDGHWRPPVLLPDHARAGEQPKPIDHRTLRTLRRMMRASVSRGTARALSEVPGSVLAKTGTAQFVDADLRRSHAWVVAARDDVAVAVVVEDARNGGKGAAPVAARFLDAL